MVGVGIWEFLIIAFIVLILFGGSRLPKIGQGLGEATRNLKKALKSVKDEAPLAAEEGKVVEIKKSQENKGPEGSSPKDNKSVG